MKKIKIVETFNLYNEVLIHLELAHEVYKTFNQKYEYEIYMKETQELIYYKVVITVYGKRKEEKS